MNDFDPFLDAECEEGAFVRQELDKAGTTLQSALMVGALPEADTFSVRQTPEQPEASDYAYYPSSMPRVDEMLYRLLALAVVAQRDRHSNLGGCFRKPNAQYDGRQFCEWVYGAASADYTPLDPNQVRTSPRVPRTFGAALSDGFGTACHAARRLTHPFGEALGSVLAS